MIEFKKITDDNFDACIKLNAGEGNDKYVAPNTISLAQAYLAVANDTCTPIPFAIYNNDDMVGFIQIAYVRTDQDEDINNPVYEIWRFMIDHKYQGKGYGKQSLHKAVEYIKTFPHGEADKILLSYVSGNVGASGLYKAIGFEETGELDEDEIIMSLKL